MLIRLRTIHPILAVMVAIYLLGSVWQIAGGAARPRSLARALTWLLVIQLAAGVMNVVLLAPVWLQLVHLLLADAVWIAYVFLGAETLAGSRSRGVLTAESARARDVSLKHA